MDIHIHIEKKHFVILVALIALLGIFMIGTAEDVNRDLPYHYLQQVAKSDSDMTSVDENEDKVIDEAENLSASADSHVLNNLIMHASLNMDGNDINNIGDLGQCSDSNSVYLDGAGNCRDLTTSPIDNSEINDGSGSGLDADMVDGKDAGDLGGGTLSTYKGSTESCYDRKWGSTASCSASATSSECNSGGDVVGCIEGFLKDGSDGVGCYCSASDGSCTGRGGGLGPCEASCSVTPVCAKVS